MALSSAERQRAYRERQKAKQAGPMPAPVPARKVDREHIKLTEETVERWLEVIAKGYSVRKAAEAVGHPVKTLQNWCDRSEENKARYRAAMELGTMAMEDEGTRRAFGYEEVTKNGKGEVIRTVQRFDSALLQLALKARRPEIYRENHVQQAQPTVIVFHSPFADLMPPVDVDAEAVEVRELPSGEDTHV